MFKNIFSFDGRIRRTEYGISFIIYIIVYFIIRAMSPNDEPTIYWVGYIPLLWFIWSQGAKRCHDLSNNGWWQIIPFYFLWLLFDNSHRGTNQYGPNPKNPFDDQNEFEHDPFAQPNPFAHTSKIDEKPEL